MDFTPSDRLLAPRVACLAAAPNSSRRFGPANEVKERLHCQALQRLSELNSRLRISNCLVSPPRNAETSIPPAEAKSASSGGVSSFCVSGQSAILFGFGPTIEVKERLQWSASEAQDVLDPPATGRGVLAGSVCRG